MYPIKTRVHSRLRGEESETFDIKLKTVVRSKAEEQLFFKGGGGGG